MNYQLSLFIAVFLFSSTYALRGTKAPRVSIDKLKPANIRSGKCFFVRSIDNNKCISAGLNVSEVYTRDCEGRARTCFKRIKDEFVIRFVNHPSKNVWDIRAGGRGGSPGELISHQFKGQDNQKWKIFKVKLENNQTVYAFKNMKTKKYLVLDGNEVAEKRFGGEKNQLFKLEDA